MNIICDLGVCRLEEIVSLWHETQMGNIHKCREKQVEFSDIMWKLHEKLKAKEEDTRLEDVLLGP